MNGRAFNSTIVAIALVIALLVLITIKFTPLLPFISDALERHAENTVELLAVGIGDAVLQKDTNRLTAQLDVAVKHTSLYSARVTNRDNSVLAEISPPQTGIAEKDLTTVSRDLYKNGQYIGRIETKFSSEILQKEMDKMYQPYQLANLIVLGLSVFIALMLAGYLSVKHKRELRRLRDACGTVPDETISKENTNIDYNTTLSCINKLREDSRQLDKLLAFDEKKQSKAELAQELVEQFSYAGTWIWDFEKSSFGYSKEFLNIFGLAEGDLKTDYESIFQLIPEDERPDYENSLLSAMEKYEPFELSHRVLHASGGERTVKQRAKVIFDNTGQASFIIGCMRDITERRQTKEDLALTAQVFEYSLEGIVITDAKCNILRVNKAFCDITGYSEEEVVGNNPSMLRSGRHEPDFYKNMWHSLDEKGQWHGEVWNRRKGGEIYPEWLAVRAVKDDAGKVRNYIGIFDDISEQKAAEERIERLAYYDALTDLPNRLMFHGRLKLAMADAERHEYMLAILSIDLDRFKNINDTLGHTSGDELLQLLAQRLKANTRQCDMLARLGGDEFVIMLSELHHQHEIIQIAEKIIQSMAQPFILDGSEVFVTSSIGIAMFPIDNDNNDLLKNADTAMFHAKKLGGNNYQFYLAEMNTTAAEKLFMESSLHRAQERSEFMLYYQPQVDLNSGEIVGVESLIRWRHPELGQVRREQFIPALEDTGLILKVGEWVLHTACEQQVAWQRDIGKQLKVAVNLSPLQFANSKRLLETISRVVEETGIDPELLELEITEGV